MAKQIDPVTKEFLDLSVSNGKLTSEIKSHLDCSELQNG
jgi:hypothetical protein